MILIKSLLILLVSMQAVLASSAICKHGPPQTLGIEIQPKMKPLPFIFEPISVHSSIKNKPVSFKHNNQYSKRMRLLLLSATNDEGLEPTITLAKKVLNNYGIPFDHHYMVQAGEVINSLPNLVDALGRSLYYGVVFTTNQLAYEAVDKNFRSALNPEQWTIFRQYLSQFDLRLVSLYSFPNPSLGVEYIQLNDPGQEFVLSPSRNLVELDTAYPKNIKFSLKGSWAYGAKILDPQKSTPILSYGDSELASAILHKTMNNTEEMHFFFAQSQFFTSSLTLSSAWIHWLTRGVYQGKRRIMLNVHIDDVFLGTGLFSAFDILPDSNITDRYVYRLNSDDMLNYVYQQQYELAVLANNPAFKIELAFNGNGIWENGGYGRDSLLDTSIELFEHFFWLTHTYSHGDLNWFNYPMSKLELEANILIAQDFVPTTSSNYSPRSIVTPRISGLFNPRALQAMLDVGLQYATGDNTRPEIVPKNIHHGLYTTRDFNGYDGLFIIPRYATEIYYNVSLPREQEAEYNFIYSAHFGYKSSIDQILEREASRVTRQLLSYEYAPYMFHQANLRSFEWSDNRESLITLWVKSVIGELRKFSNLPVLAHKMDDLAPYFLDRMQTDACGVEIWQNYKENLMHSIEVNTQQKCLVSITGLNKQLPYWQLEKYGMDLTQEIRTSGRQNLLYPLQ
jgi:hypothetical protein